MGVLTVYQCDEPGCTREGKAGVEPVMGWVSIPEAFVLGRILGFRNIVLCPEHRPAWIYGRDNDTEPTE